MVNSFVISFDKEVGTWSITHRTPEAGAWLEKQTGRRGTVDNLNQEGVQELASRAQKAAFTVHWVNTVDGRETR